jgi:hypothetical protein
MEVVRCAVFSTYGPHRTVDVDGAMPSEPLKLLLLGCIGDPFARSATARSTAG